MQKSSNQTNMKLIEAIRLFEAETGRKSTVNDYPYIVKKYGPQETTPKFESATEALLHCLASFNEEDDGTRCEGNPEWDKRYEEIAKELGIDPETTDMTKSNIIADTIVKRHPEIFDLDNIREYMLVLLVKPE